jgi:hypothetical protein
VEGSDNRPTEWQADDVDKVEASVIVRIGRAGHKDVGPMEVGIVEAG